jgi:uncharacterized protein with PIN domain
MKFLVDRHLRGLAKWLRLAGFDAVVADLADLPQAVSGTYLLTSQKGRRLLKRDDVLVLAAPHPEDQLAEVARRLGISPGDLAPLSRCGACNDPLTPVPREAALGAVPDHVFHTQAEFFQCPRCRRFFWPGSHPARIAAKLHQALSEPDGGALVNTPFRKGASHGV